MAQEKNGKRNTPTDQNPGRNTMAPAGGREAAAPRKKRLSATQMEDIRWDADHIFKENPYYIKIANRYRVGKYIAVVLTLAFGIFMLSSFSGQITAESFQYLIKDLDFSAITTIRDFDTLVYNATSDSRFGIYRGELAVATAGSTSLYKPSGALSVTVSNNYFSPSLLTSDKYFLVYDRGDVSCAYSVFNAFAELKSDSLSYPITTAALCDEGSYAIVTRDDNYRGIVLVYDPNFRLKMEIRKDKYVPAVDLSKDGRELAVASVYDEDGAFSTEIQLIETGASEAALTIIRTGTMPLKVKILDNGFLGVLFTDHAAIFDREGKEAFTLSYASMPFVNAVIGDSALCVLYNTTVIGSEKTALIYSSDGTEIFRGEVSGELMKMTMLGSRCYLLFEDHASMIDPETGETATAALDPNPLDILTVEETPLVCYAGKAHTLSFTGEKN